MDNPLATTPFLCAVKELFDGLAASLPEDAPLIKAYVAGGAAAHWWTQSRSTDDVDAEFSHRLIMAGEVIIFYEDEKGRHALELDRQYNPSFGLAQEDYHDRAANTLGLLGGKGRIDVLVLAPVDLALSKLARWAEVDQQDVRSLASAGLLDRNELASLAEEAMMSAVGINMVQLRYNLLEAIDYVDQYSPKKSAAPRP